MTLSPETLPAIQGALRHAGLDGWLLYDFRGANPVAASLLGFEGMVTRRVFVWIPASGDPVAVTHAIEQGPWRAWPAAWGKVVYSAWGEFEAALPPLVGGRRIAMEYSPGDAVPVVDRVPGRGPRPRAGERCRGGHERRARDAVLRGLE